MSQAKASGSNSAPGDRRRRDFKARGAGPKSRWNHPPPKQLRRKTPLPSASQGSNPPPRPPRPVPAVPAAALAEVACGDDEHLDVLETFSQKVGRLLGHRLPESEEGATWDNTSLYWQWMVAEHQPCRRKQSSIEYRLMRPRKVTAPLVVEQAWTEQSYANAKQPLRALADLLESSNDAGILYSSFGDYVRNLPSRLTRRLGLGVSSAWGSSKDLVTGTVRSIGVAASGVLTKDSLSSLQSTSTQKRIAGNGNGARYWVTGEKAGEKESVRTRYCVVGQARPNWFGADVKYPKSVCNSAGFGPSTGLIYTCVELVAYLRRFAEFRQRSVGNVRVLQARAVQWCKEHGISDVDAAIFRAPSVIQAFTLMEGELAAHQLGNSTSFANSVRVSNLLEKEVLDTATDRSVLSWLLGATPLRSLVGDIQIYHPKLKFYQFGLEDDIPDIYRNVGVPYIGFLPWFRLRQLLTPVVSIPLH